MGINLPPLFQCDIQKQFNGEYWTNRYMLSSASREQAEASALELVAAERLTHSNQILFDRVRVSDTLPNTSNYSIIPLTGVGGYSDSGGMLPLFNVMRIDFRTAVGRPSRKYIRAGLSTLSMGGNFILNDAQKARGNSYITAVLAVEEYVDVDGEDIIAGVVLPTIAMRQLRRGSKRRTTPVV